MQSPIIIIGGGLSGLTLAYLLHQKQIPVLVFEASDRIGGRIQTIQGSLHTPLELGATWLSDQHPHLLSLVGELGLKKYPQFAKGKSLFQTKSFEPPQEFHVAESEMPSYRIAGGTSEIIRTLAAQLPATCIRLDHRVTEIQQTQTGIQVITSQGEMVEGRATAICLPPELAHASIQFHPALPLELTDILPTVQTWMAGSIKFVLEYATPFWREAGYSGMLYSHAGLVTEMYDHTNFEENRFGFTGFLNGGAAQYTQEVRKEWVLKQLTEVLGEKMATPTTYQDKVWNDSFTVGRPILIQRPHQNNGHSTLQQSYWNDQLFFGSTETSSRSPGYMEGAVQAAKRIAAFVLGKLIG